MTPLADLYDRRIAEGALRDDPVQRAVFPEFERLRAALSRPARKSGFFSRRSPEPVKGLYLWGGVGRGKSMLMDLFFESVEAEEKRRVHFHAFMQEVHAGMIAARKQGVDDALEPVGREAARDTRLLCLDEMQITDITDAMIVGRLFEMLIKAGVVIVTTSNRVPDDLYKDGLNRQLFLPFIDFLKEHMVIHELVVERDYRQDRLAGSQVYFSPEDGAARAAMDSLWNDLATAEVAPLVLHVKGRQVELPRFSNGVARATFWELCGRALGAADYLAVADAVRILMLDGIPRLSSDNYNEAKRFVTLVDALYEARVRLIASAADVPERLYSEGAGSFEFERTASRLREMQSEGWGG
ncbi:cell division protein ZapE [Oceaniglobus trochenteri]|uniref:cell division protein ZapE n=1 Tax=Oceaniglobus trochenteri TaxID=2763260 RepID=UPI001CFF5994|nr:cell division protein ZapE [Oceaniglobus trochenteri]